MKFLNSIQTANTLVNLIDTHSNTSFAVAWAGTRNEVFKKLKDSKHKIRQSVIGTHFHQTDPKVMEWCLSEQPEIQFIIDPNPNSVFHPKIYIFWSNGGRWDLIIGSANLTTGGMNNNDELMLHVSSEDCDDEEIFRQSLKEIEEYWNNQSRSITRRWLNEYLPLYRQQRRKQLLTQQTETSEYEIPKLLSYDWPTFYSKVVSEQFDDGEPVLPVRLALLRKARSTFEEYKNFKDMPLDDRRGIAATVFYGQSGWEDLSIGWFGFQSQSGIYKGMIRDNNVQVSRALSHIPAHGNVYRHDYKACVEEMKQGYGQHYQQTGGISHLSRLLALKRPDVFVSFNNGIKPRLANALGIKDLKAKEFDRYWDEVIVRIIDEAPWYNTHRPTDPLEAKVWDYRVAMVDAIYYFGRSRFVSKN